MSPFDDISARMRNETDDERQARIQQNAAAMRNMSAECQRISDLLNRAAQQSESNLVIFEQKVIWTDIIGDVEEVSGVGTTLREAIMRAFVKAEAQGWTPKKWWQFWRWQDTPDLRKTLKFYGQKT